MKRNIFLQARSLTRKSRLIQKTCRCAIDRGLSGSEFPISASVQKKVKILLQKEMLSTYDEHELRHLLVPVSKKSVLSSSNLSIFNQLKERRETLGNLYGIDANIIASRIQLEKIAAGDDLSLVLLPWQAEMLFS